jgi:hypothetical protein
MYLEQLADMWRATFKPLGVKFGDRPKATPWLTAPDGYRPFDNAGSIATPAVGADTTITTFTVPLGMDGVITRLSNGYTGPGFQDGAGDIVWRILIDGVAVQGYDAISVRLGDMNNPTNIVPGIRVYSGQVVTFIVNNVTGLLPAIATQCTGRLGGYYYPRGV